MASAADRRAQPEDVPSGGARQALAFADAQRWPEAAAAAQGADPLIGKAITWMRVRARGSGATASEIVGFTRQNPAWPGQDLLARRAEEALAGDPDDVLAAEWFADRAPQGLDGYQRAADLLVRSGRPAAAAEMLRRGWAAAPGDALDEAEWLERNAAALPADVHWRRFDRTALLRQGVPARLVPFLDTGRQGIAAARLAYAADAPDADNAAVAAAAPGDAGLTYERARWLRRREQDETAAAAWAAGAAAQRDLPPEAARVIWTERQILARKLLRLGQPRLAYRVAAEHGQAAAGEPRQEAEFLAGFIALRMLGEPKAAEAHFVAVGAGSRSVITGARSLYWQGRAAQAQGAPARARERYGEAAALPLAFYGQLAAVALGEDGAALSRRIVAAPEPPLIPVQAAALEALDPAQTALLLSRLGEGRRARTFLLRLEELSPEPSWKLLIVRLAQRTGRPDNTVWVVRRAGAAGLMAVRDGWPAPYAAPDATLEPAVINAITRQESNFDPEAVSSSNARGLMQLLPGTAQQVARRLKLRHQTSMLTADPEHNMRLGAAYLAELQDRFGGALPLAIAGYNAGPGRVTEWVGSVGDPQSGAIGMLDWMELIPFSETRNYVQRVIENIAIYRALDPAAAAQPHPMASWLRDGA